MNLINAHFRTMPEEETKQLFIEFVQKVRSMRDFQKEYFKTRNTLVLAESKKAEREVDNLIVNLFKEDDSPTLF